MSNVAEDIHNAYEKGYKAGLKDGIESMKTSVCYWRKAKPTDPLSFKGCYDECSVCGKVVFFGHEENYCPGCGSKTGGYLFE